MIDERLHSDDHSLGQPYRLRIMTTHGMAVNNAALSAVYSGLRLHSTLSGTRWHTHRLVVSYIKVHRRTMLLRLNSVASSCGRCMRLLLIPGCVCDTDCRRGQRGGLS